jgi:hypothetical protein
MEQRKIEHTIVDIDSIETHPKNVRQGDIGAISESLKAHGQYRPIVVDKRTNRILAGNHTWKAAKSLGWTQIAVGFIETKDDDDALRILLADNKANDLASYNDSELVDLLKDLAESDLGLDGTLYTANELDDLYNLMNSPSLDDLIRDLGDQSESGFTATIKCVVSLDIYQLWQNLWESLKGSDSERIAQIIKKIG